MKIAKVGLIGSAVAYSSLYWFFPLLREDSTELFGAGKRFIRITSTATRIGFNYVTKGVSPEQHTNNSKLLYETLKINGGCYVKFGQVLAMLDLVVPQEYSDIMKPMLNEAPVSSFANVKQIIESELGDRLENIFMEFDTEPIASASLAQVHKAKLMTGEEVAVKVQHKWIKEEYPGDIRVLEILAYVGKKLFKEFDYVWVIEDLKRSSKQELDFNIEAQNAIRCYEIFKEDPYIKIPIIHKKYSSDRVLTMEMMKGVKVSEIEEIKKMGLELKDVAYTLSRAFNEMIFVHGFIHCDPHPGNIFVNFVTVNFRKHAQIVLLDHGLYRELSPSQLESYRNMWRAIITQNEDEMRKHAQELGVTALYPLLAGMMVGRPWDDIMDTSLGLERLRNARAYKDEKEALRNHARRWQNEINQVLGRMDNEIILLFKTFEWLRANDAALGAPVNTIQIISEYVTSKNSFWFRIWLRFKLFLYSIFA